MKKPILAKILALLAFYLLYLGVAFFVSYGFSDMTDSSDVADRLVFAYSLPARIFYPLFPRLSFDDFITFTLAFPILVYFSMGFLVIYIVNMILKLNKS